MIRKNVFIIGLIALISISWSCVSYKKMTYLQALDKVNNSIIPASAGITPITPAEYKVMPYDNLYIRVITPDPQWSSLFNAGLGSAGITQESAALSGYTVDVEGFIEIPYVGKIEVAGKTLSEIKTQLDSIFKNYVSDAAIMVRLVNNYVSVIGEVNLPGRFLLTKDRLSVFEALAMAGDAGDYSNRHRIRIIRPTPNGPVLREFSLADRSILLSDMYYVMPNDVIYAIPRRSKSFQVNSSAWTILLTTVTSALGIIAFFRTL